MQRGLRLIQEDERLTYGSLEEDGYEIYYRRIPNHVRSAIVRKHTKIGRRGVEVVNWGPASAALIAYAILDWRGVYVLEAGKKKDVPCSPENIEWIPDIVQAEIIEAAGGNPERVESDIKNLPTTHDNKPTTTG